MGSSSDPIDPLVETYANAKREGSAPTDKPARPTLYISISGGLGDWQAYAPDGSTIMDEDALPMKIVSIDWDNVEGENIESSTEEFSATEGVRNYLKDETIPMTVRADIRLSLDHARRWDEDNKEHV